MDENFGKEEVTTLERDERGSRDEVKRKLKKKERKVKTRETKGKY